MASLPKAILFLERRLPGDKGKPARREREKTFKNLF